jgi:hypothetical protein
MVGYALVVLHIFEQAFMEGLISKGAVRETIMGLFISREGWNSESKKSSRDCSLGARRDG